ncbi:hypothetical protein GQ42DRAFT_165003 [Ramicandelaber brevisporus]|nr:hypothetical protein GQ42DRAFT_165003 [Ramicandelaber brevisporus]
MATYVLSTLGHEVLAQEDSDEVTRARLVFATVTAIVGFINIWLTTLYYLSSKRSHTTRAIFAAYILHTIVHTIHYADNIVRPAAYHEPKHLYQQYLFSTMELTFYFNFPLTICGLVLMKALCRNNYLAYGYLTFYIYGSLMTLMHYRIESPWYYSTVANASISGETLSVFLFTWSAFAFKQRPHLVASMDRYYKLFILAYIVISIGMVAVTNVF